MFLWLSPCAFDLSQVTAAQREHSSVAPACRACSYLQYYTVEEPAQLKAQENGLKLCCLSGCEACVAVPSKAHHAQSRWASEQLERGFHASTHSVTLSLWSL